MLLRIILFIILNSAALSSAYLWSVRLWPYSLGQPALPVRARPARVLTTILFFFGQVTLILTCLGTLGLLRLLWVTASVIIIFLITFILLKKLIPCLPAGRVRPSLLSPPVRCGGQSTFSAFGDPISTFLFSLAAVILVLLVFMALLVPPYSWDSLTYHLTSPVEWMKKGTIQIIPTPFGDQAPAYSPANGELFFLWLMLPLGSDLFARVGGLPFYLLSALTIYLITRRVGASAKGALLGTSLFLITPNIMRYAATPEVDLVALFFFLSATYFLILFLEHRNPKTLALTSIAIGLYLGSKYVALAFAPLLILLSIYAIFFQAKKLRRPSFILRDAGIFLAGLLVFGSFWYLRNLIETGSPTYPMSLGLGGLPAGRQGFTLFQGAYPRSVMTNSIFHLQGFKNLFSTNLRAYGGVLALVYPLALFTLVFHQVLSVTGHRSAQPKLTGLAEEGQIKKHHLLLLVAPLLLSGVHWWLIPYNAEWRFLFPALALSFISVGFIYSKIGRAAPGRKASARAGRLFSVAVLLLVILSIFIGLKRKDLWPLVPEWAIYWVLPLALIMAALIYLTQKKVKGLKRFFCWALLAAVVTLGNNLFFWTLFFPRHIPPPFRKIHLAKALELFVFLGQRKMLPVDLSSTTYGHFYQGWLFVWENLSGTRLAYAGRNIPYHLYGQKLENEVFYVNIDSHLNWKFHDYDLYERERPDYKVPATPKPAYYRRRPGYEAWLANLQALNIDYLFLYTLHPVEKKYMKHDEEDFPLENIWAQGNPEDFDLIFDNPSIRLYRLAKKAPQ